MQTSQLRPYSLGIAAENKPRSARHLNITPTEALPALDGEINFNPQRETFSGVDSKGDPYEVAVNKDVSLNAEWLPFGSNRVTPPDIRRGEPILIYRMADSDRYFWECLGLRDDLRRLETVIFAISADPNPNSEGLDISKCYFIEVSSHDKMVTLGTSKANGEPFAYTAQFNTGTGEFVLEDDIGDHLYLNSGSGLWEMKNADGSHYRLDRKNILIKAPTNIDLTAGTGITLKAGNQIYMEAPTISSKASSITSEASEISHTSPNSSYSGNLNVGANLGVGGNMSVGGGGGGGGDIHISGNGTFDGSLTFSGTVTAQTINCVRLVASNSVSAPNL
jgi:hypothetical protein